MPNRKPFGKDELTAEIDYRWLLGQESRVNQVHTRTTFKTIFFFKFYPFQYPMYTPDFLTLVQPQPFSMKFLLFVLNYHSH